jgi:hypothetical protein
MRNDSPHPEKKKKNILRNDLRFIKKRGKIEVVFRFLRENSGEYMTSLNTSLFSPV